MERMPRERLRWIIWSALRFPPKMDQKVFDKLAVLNPHGSLDRLVERICDHVDGDKRGVYEAGDDGYLKPVKAPPKPSEKLTWDDLRGKAE